MGFSGTSERLRRDLRDSGRAGFASVLQQKMPRAQQREFLHDSKNPQLWPQLPQLLSSLVVLVSQPSTALPLQLA